MEREVEDEKMKGSVIVEVKEDDNGRSRSNAHNNICESSNNKNEEEQIRDGGEEEVEKMCRICHLSNRDSEELIQLGCGCKQELGASHLTCAQTWFKLKGNRLCEICGKSAVNVSGVEEMNNNSTDNNNNRGVILVVEWEEVSSRRNREVNPDGCQRTFRNVVLTCLLLAFVVPWLFRINLF